MQRLLLCLEVTSFLVVILRKVLFIKKDLQPKLYGKEAS